MYCYDLLNGLVILNVLDMTAKRLNAQGYKHSQSEFQATLKEPHIVSRNKGSQSSNNFQEF